MGNSQFPELPAPRLFPELPDHDLTVADVARLVGIGKTLAYRQRYFGEYQVGEGQKARRIRREEFLYRRNNGLNVVASKE